MFLFLTILVHSFSSDGVQRLVTSRNCANQMSLIDTATFVADFDFHGLQKFVLFQ